MAQSYGVIFQQTFCCWSARPHLNPTRDTASWLLLDSTANVPSTTVMDNALLTGVPAARCSRVDALEGMDQKKTEYFVRRGIHSLIDLRHILLISHGFENGPMTTKILADRWVWFTYYPVSDGTGRWYQVLLDRGRSEWFLLYKYCNNVIAFTSPPWWTMGTKLRYPRQTDRRAFAILQCAYV